MGIRERRQRETLRSGILAAAQEIARAEGWQAVAIRRIAARVEYSRPAIYEYFDSEEHLLLELMRMGYVGQTEAIEKARDASDVPEEALLAMSRAWCRLAFEAPDLYQVMCGLGGVSCPVAELRKEGEKTAAVIAQVLEATFAKNGTEPEDVRGKVTLSWGMLHGLVALDMAGRLPGGREEAERLADQAARDFPTAWLN